ncbi:recombinase family protein [Sphingomonas echinoides]|uniref:Recombinase family protein n=1 Tax=Sphingomonas echinoides TaxID=59803 RepID=A0ABU4PSM7_9SPHN|nr:recombinase family protein [Sphingomonas echinoides]MDX5986409.1 recombinase family protein [Sphingomonas echinoides]
MIVGYARLSTRDPSPAVQLDALHHAGCECVFTEKMSGAQRERPELKAALNYLNAGDTLMVWKLDRLARSTRQLVATTAELQRRNVGLRVLTQAIDTTTPGGSLVFHVFAAVAEFERELGHERTHAGLAQAKAMGRRGGRKPSMGPAEIKRARAMLANPSITVGEIAQQLGVQPSTLYRHIPGGRSAVVQESVICPHRVDRFVC